jgi:23S rRNA pseudouridine1911/1915/1917 synthase
MTDGGGSEHRVTAGPDSAGARLDRLIADRVPGLSRSQAQALIAAGRVSQAGATIAEPSYRVKPGQAFRVVVPPPVAAKPQPEAIPLVVLYEDAHLLVIDKPAGMVVHPAPGSTRGTLVNALLAHCGDSLSGIGGVRRPGIVHRLDKDTSGLMVIAKDDTTHRDLAAQFAGHTVARAYRALAWGVPRPAEGVVEGNIGRATHDRKKMAVVEKGGKRAVTRYKVVRRVGRAASLVECRLETGRTHQIRVHMAKIGHPVVGDPAYGGGAAAARRFGAAAAIPAIAAVGHQALDAYRLGFVHPATGRHLDFAKDSPSFMSTLERCLENI